MKFAAVLALTVLALQTPVAAAEPAGRWHVAGKVSSFAFTLNCTFQTAGARLGGVCVDASTNDPKVAAGKAHPLTAGAVDGDKVRWTYQSSFLFSKFDVTFDGTQTGDRMSGVIQVQGRQGEFSAERF